MQNLVTRQNIERYRRMLRTETDEAARSVLLKLLSEEEAKLAEMERLATPKAAE